MKTTLENIKSYATLMVAIIAILGWAATFVSNRVGLKKDVEQLQKDVTEVKGDVKAIHDTQLEDAEEKGKIFQYIESHNRLHETLH